MSSRELELQKKREEAERKARRGEIDPTHEFTIQVSRNTNQGKMRSGKIENQRKNAAEREREREKRKSGDIKPHSFEFHFAAA